MDRSSLFTSSWREAVPNPIYEDYPEYTELYYKAWELAFAHIKEIPGMPQTPYMDEAFCNLHIWIWDTCFMSLFCKYAGSVFPGVESFRNFYEVLHADGRLPAVIATEDDAVWTGRVPGEPYELQIHIADNPPLFAWGEYQNALLRGDKNYLKRLLYEEQFLQKHYEWIESLRESVIVKGVFVPTCLIADPYGYKWEGGRSGMDNTPRGRCGERTEEQRPNNPDMLWIDAICQQALSADMIAKLFSIVGDTDACRLWNERFLEKNRIINELYWDDEDGFYYDIDCHTHRAYKVKSIASYWTMTAGIAPNDRAVVLVKELENAETFGGPVPFPSLARNDGDFQADGEYWRGSVWLPTAYAALVGLKNYGFYREAHELSCRLLEHMCKTYAEFEPHTIWEAYSPEKHEPAYNETGTATYVRPDFCGWSALGPISSYIEFVLGFHTIDAFKKQVEWAKPETVTGKIGIKNLRFGNIVTDIEAVGDTCVVKTNERYCLVVNGKSHEMLPGVNTVNL